MLKEAYNRFLREAGGADAGKYELMNLTYEQALELSNKWGFDAESEIPQFKRNFQLAQKLAGNGRTRRKDMPVIDSSDVRMFQDRLKHGSLDIEKPFSRDTEANNPFPEGLSGKSAKDFINRGVRDGSMKDDEVKVGIVKKAVKDLRPIQRQIYFDKSWNNVAKNGVENSINFLTNKSYFITSADNYIIDGHHRFLSTLLIDPSLKVNTLSIDLPIRKLLPLSLAYGDAIGNKRNA